MSLILKWKAKMHNVWPLSCGVGLKSNYKVIDYSHDKCAKTASVGPPYHAVVAVACRAYSCIMMISNG